MPPSAATRSSRPSPAERAERGKAARGAAPRRSPAAWEPAADRPDPVDLLEEQARTRVPELVPIRYGRMLVSPFAFFRGAALIMAADLAATPDSGITVQLCGDAHLSNFGVFGTPERRLLFDINDFDETLPGPWEWDVKRLAASFAVAGREQGLVAKRRAEVVADVVRTYRSAMRSFAAMRNLDVWYAHVDAERLLDANREELGRKALSGTEATLAKARTRDSLRAFDRLTHVVDGHRRIVSDPPLIIPVEELSSRVAGQDLAAWWTDVFSDYRGTLRPDRRQLLEQFELVHFAHKVVGVGSVGTMAWITLLLGRDDADPLFLQVKEAQASVLERFLPESVYETHGERIVVGQRLMQAASDTFLGWKHVEDFGGRGPRDFYVRQLHDWKGGVDVAALPRKGLQTYGRLCGWTLARAHARSGDRIAIAAYLGGGTAFDEALVTFAEAYADQNERDYAALAEAVESGRVKAERGL
jgi:uncharacterized protein (DUF2252 family)